MIAIIVIKLLISTGWSWSGYERQLYQERRFVELEQKLFLSQNQKNYHLIVSQAQDLIGCKEIHSGRGGGAALIKCARFLKREEVLRLHSPRKEELLADLDILCTQFAENKSFLSSVINIEGVFLATNWKKCHTAVWKQIYLTAYRNFPSNPIRVMSWFKKAKKALGPDRFWSSKAEELLK